MKNKFIIILLSVLFIACSKDVNLNKSEPSIKNQELIISSEISTRVNGEDYLTFNSKEDALNYYNELNKLSDSWDYESEESKEYNESVNGDPAIYAHNAKINFYSLEQYYDDLDAEGIEFREDENYIGTPILQSLLSYQKEISIGDTIYKYLDMGKIALISNLSKKGLEDVRLNNVHSFHKDVEYYDITTKTRSKNLPEIDDPDNNNNCLTFLSVAHRTYKGSLANKVRISSRIINLPAECYGNVKTEIDWGDGTITNGTIGSHSYNIPEWITSTDCVYKTIKVTTTWLKDCGGCEKGKKHVITKVVKLCPEYDCSDYEGPGKKIKTFDFSWEGNTYRIIGELGVDNTVFLFLDVYNVWGKSTFQRRKSNGGWKKWTPKKLGVKVHGRIWREDTCIMPESSEYSKVFDDDPVIKRKNKVKYEYRSSWPRPIFTKKYEEEKLFSDHFVLIGNQKEEILNVTLWD